MMKLFAALALVTAADSISFRAGDGRLLYGDVYGGGDRGVVILAHGGYSTRPTRTKQPKEFVLVEGSAHGQNLLSTPDGPAVIRDIVRFVKNGRF